ncbi:hypothetical protein R3Q06_10735 [Rhodococcus erythropolis]|uniref:hypothetical protein n=1 Tax=Rhodococcus erythropolis TaxID=1833 RepID=UPI002949FA02|nr:hypothetical protein [Rhodococcus erythropolis]MDV6273974.1 hypothetical protein [Rhodococcus erythropolis]
MTNTVHEKSGFWSRPTVRKVLLLIVVYLAFYLAVGQVTSRVFADQIDTDNVVASASRIIFGAAAVTSLLTVLLVVFGVIAILLIRDRIGEERPTRVSA